MLSIAELLDRRDKSVSNGQSDFAGKPRLNFLPFYDYGPSISDVKQVGRGIDFLNKYMSSGLFQDPEKWNAHLFEFLKIHHSLM